MKKIYNQEHILKAHSLTLFKKLFSKNQIWLLAKGEAILQCCRIVEASSTNCNIEAICAKVCKKSFTWCKKFLFNFASTLCNFLKKEF